MWMYIKVQYTASYDGTVRKITDGGKQVWKHTQASNLVGVEAGQDKYVYAASSDGKIKKISPAGQKFDSYNVEDGNVLDVAVSPVTDSGTQYVAAGTGFSSELTYAWNQSPVPVDLSQPDYTNNDHGDRVRGVAADKEGSVYTASGGTVRKIDPRGETVWTNTDHVEFVEDVAVDEKGSVYTASADNTVRKLDPQGNEQWRYTDHTNAVLGVAVDKDGNVYSASSDETVRKLDSQGNEQWTYNDDATVYDIVAGSKGNVYTALGDDTVKKINPQGGTVWTNTDHESTVNGVAVDQDGNLYSASIDDTVKKIGPQGETIWTYTDHTSNVYDVTVDNEGYVYSASTDGTVKKITPKGNTFDTFQVNDEFAFSITVSPVTDSGTQYVAAGIGNNNNRVYRWTVGDIAEKFGNPDWNNNDHTLLVGGVAVDEDGNVYSASFDTTVKKIDPQGDTVWTNNDHTNYVNDVAVGAEGYIYSASLDGTVRKITPDGNTFDTFQVDDEEAFSVAVSPVSDSGTQYVAVGTAFSNDRVYRWSFDVGGSSSGPPSISICDSRGPFNQCISNSFHGAGGQAFSISAPLIIQQTASFQAPQTTQITVSNNTKISGTISGSANITATANNKITIRAGAKLKPNNGKITVGN